MKHITLCADDYAQHPAINDGILALVEQKRLNAVSCMVTSPYWSESARDLQASMSTAQIGLHLNFTFGTLLSHTLTAYSLSTLIAYTFTRRLPFLRVRAEIEAQIHAFAEKMQRWPDFIDGHEHVHQFPIIRDALLAVYADLGLKARIRNTYNGYRDYLTLRYFPKRQAIAVLGGRALCTRLEQKKILTNSTFYGIYSFKNAVEYRKYFQAFLAETENNGLIMCHPGKPSTHMHDPLHASRACELAYLSSDAFLDDLSAYACCLYSQELSFRQDANERGEGVYIQYMTEAERIGNTAENLSAKSIEEL